MNLLFASPQETTSSFKLPEYLPLPTTGRWSKLPRITLRDLVTLATAGAHAHTMEIQLYNTLKVGSVPPVVDQWIAAFLMAGIAQALRTWMRRHPATLGNLVLPQNGIPPSNLETSAPVQANTAPSSSVRKDETPAADAPNKQARILPPRITPTNRMAANAISSTSGVMAEAKLFRLGNLVRAQPTPASNTQPSGQKP
ncbi:hypothetical protein KIK84_04770 [Curvibacter sp. CHRR-16]|uniref:hypothetical protein n=1 Tax=Curvibacter sp. CHRR-16 TaxID=2835872 RepID=UPI001BD91EBA|nr:hypothetical protein [Curvibacter sp. CHRR-16]MBT0569626.1 hypothetical protein [Curvibacter sp. CHRR-16]